MSSVDGTATPSRATSPPCSALASWNGGDRLVPFASSNSWIHSPGPRSACAAASGSGASVAGDSVAGGSVAGASVAGGSVGAASVGAGAASVVAAALTAGGRGRRRRLVVVGGAAGDERDRGRIDPATWAQIVSESETERRPETDRAQIAGAASGGASELGELWGVLVPLVTVERAVLHLGAERGGVGVDADGVPPSHVQSCSVQSHPGSAGGTRAPVQYSVTSTPGSGAHPRRPRRPRGRRPRPGPTARRTSRPGSTAWRRTPRRWRSR